MVKFRSPSVTWSLLVIFGNLDGGHGAVAGPEWSRTRDALTGKPAFKAAKELNQWWQEFRHEHHAASSPHRTKSD